MGVGGCVQSGVSVIRQTLTVSLDERPARKLIERALAAPRDSHARWRSVYALQRRGDEETFAAAARLLDSAEARRRKLGADILRQLGADIDVPVEARPYRGRCVEVLLERVTVETDPRVLRAIAIACGHLSDVRCVPALHKLRSHDDPDVRYAVASGLLGLDDDLAVDTLAELSNDADASVREWATFGLARQIERDTPQVRDALLARIDDPDAETRAEALAGLAERGDARAVGPLLNELNGAPQVDDPELLDDALLALTIATKDRRLCRLVMATRDDWNATMLPDPLPPDLERAVQACVGT